MAKRAELWEASRNTGVPVPMLIGWVSHEPATTREAGFVPFDLISK
jgi:hypothetical protein